MLTMKDVDENSKLSLKSLLSIAGGREEFSPLELLGMPGIPAHDKIYTVFRNGYGALPKKIALEFACLCVEQGLALVDAKDPCAVAAKAAVSAKRAWLKGEISDEELASSSCAARNAAKNLPNDPNSATLRRVAILAADTATYSEEYGAAYEEARAASDTLSVSILGNIAGEGKAFPDAWSKAFYAARDASQEQQVNMIINLLLSTMEKEV